MGAGCAGLRVKRRAGAGEPAAPRDAPRFERPRGAVARVGVARCARRGAHAGCAVRERSPGWGLGRIAATARDRERRRPLRHRQRARALVCRLIAPRCLLPPRARLWRAARVCVCRLAVRLRPAAPSPRHDGLPARPGGGADHRPAGAVEEQAHGEARGGSACWAGRRGRCRGGRAGARWREGASARGSWRLGGRRRWRLIVSATRRPRRRRAMAQPQRAWRGATARPGEGARVCSMP